MDTTQTSYDALAVEAFQVQKFGRAFKQLNTKRLRDEAAKAARDYSRRVTNVSPIAVNDAARELAHAAQRAWGLALDRVGRDEPAGYVTLYARLRQDGYTDRAAGLELFKAGYSYGQVIQAHRVWKEAQGIDVQGDVLVTGLGESVVQLHPLSAEARAWFAANVQAEPWQWLGPVLGVDHRFAGDLITGLTIDGLRVVYK